MRLPAQLLSLALVLVVCAASAAGAKPVSVSLGAKITDVDTAKKRATINRGSKAGLHVGDDGGVYGMRGDAKGNLKQTVSTVERAARGKIVSIKDASAVIALDTILETVEVGAYFSTSTDAPPPLAESPLFLIVARGIELRVMDDHDKLFVTVEEMLANPSPAFRDKVIDAMIAEMKENKDIIDSVGRIDGGGKYHGKQATTVVDELTRADLLDFFAFVEAYPGKYLNQRWSVAEIFFTWVMSGAESGVRELKLRKLEPAVTAAQNAAVAGNLDDARTKWNAILREVPDYSDARSAIETIDKLQVWMRTVADDPDDTSTRYELASKLFDFGAYSLALQQVDALAKAKYNPYDTEFLRARVLAFQRKWPASEATFKRLLKEHPNGEGLEHWLAYVKAHARIDRAPDEAAGYLELGQVFYDQHDWERALKEYRKAIERKGVTQAQIDLVKAAQQKVAIEIELAQRNTWGRNAILEHDLAKGREQLEICLKLIDKLGNPKRANWILSSFEGAAGSASESELELELATRRAQIIKDDEATDALAKKLVKEDRFDEAVAALSQTAHPSLYMLLQIAHARGDLVELERLAKSANPKFTGALPYLAQVEAARGNWQEAVAHARKYETSDGWDTGAQRTLNATLRGLQAHEALLASSSSARERLRLVRALAELGLVKEATTELGKLPADGTWRSEAWWSIANSSDEEMALAPRLAAARSAKVRTPFRKRRVALLEARARLREKPGDEANRTTLAKLYIELGKNHEALAALGPLKTPPVKPAVADLMRAGREASQAFETFTTIDEAIDREDYAGAMKMATDYQALADRTGNVVKRVAARGARASVLTAQGRYSEAIAIAEENKLIMTADGDPISIVQADSDIARLKAALGTSDALRVVLLKTLQLCDDLDNDRCLYDTHLELGQLDSRDGRLASAIDHTRRAWTLAERLGMWLNGQRPKEQLARLNYAAGRYADAEPLFRELLVENRKGYFAKAGDEVDLLLMLGAISDVLGDGAAARTRYKEVYDLGTRTGNSGWRAAARRMEGSSWVTDHQPAKAVLALEQAAGLLGGATDRWSITTRASALRGLADARLELNKLPGAPPDGLVKARQEADEALKLVQPFQDRTTLLYTHLLFADIALAEGKADDALARSTTALQLGKLTDDPDTLVRCWHALAKSYALKNRDSDAADAYDKALENQAQVLLAVGGESFREKYMASGDGRELYTDAVELFLKLGKTTRAMDVLELSRDAQLKQAFDPAEADTADPALRARLDKYGEERARVKALQQQIAEAANKPGAQRSETQLKTLGDLLAQSQQNLKTVASDLKGSQQALYRVMAVDPQRLLDRRKQLPAGAVLVEYYAADDMLYAFVVTAASDKPTLVRVKVTNQQLAKTVEEFREAIVQENEAVKARDKVESLGRQLEDWLLQPLHKELAGATTVIILPFGALNYLPFDALVVSEPKKPVRYAVEDYRISVQTAMTIERLLEPARRRATGTLLAISNPDGSLPGAQREVSSIVKTIPDARVLARKEATLKKFIDVVGGFRYIHVASHGILDPDPWKSYLKLADAHLTVSAIAKLAGLRTSTELVVLSACESATSASSGSSDDPMSLAGGFTWAGAPAIVASLWEVGDDSTAELMATFYRALEANTSDRLEALRNAKLNLLRGKQGKSAPYAAPWHWASFQMYGDFRAPAGP